MNHLRIVLAAAIMAAVFGQTACADDTLTLLRAPIKLAGPQSHQTLLVEEAPSTSPRRDKLGLVRLAPSPRAAENRPLAAINRSQVKLVNRRLGVVDVKNQ